MFSPDGTLISASAAPHCGMLIIEAHAVTLTLKVASQFFPQDTSSHDYTPLYQVWLKKVERFRKYRPSKSGHTERRTEGHNDSSLTTPPNPPTPTPIAGFVTGKDRGIITRTFLFDYVRTSLLTYRCLFTEHHGRKMRKPRPQPSVYDSDS